MQEFDKRNSNFAFLANKDIPEGGLSFKFKSFVVLLFPHASPRTQLLSLIF